MTARLTPALLALVLASAPVSAQTTAGPDLKTEIGSLGSLDYTARTHAAREIRRAPEAAAIAALTATVTSPGDEFVRYRALVLLSSFSERATGDLVRTLLRDRNDRLRQVSYEWLEQHPDPALTDTLLGLLQTEQAEFVRPALVRALAALGTNPAVQRALVAEAGRGLDLFRSAVIDALGDHHAAYAVDTIANVSTIDGPLREDAVLALGRIGGARAKAALDALSGAKGDIALTVRAARCLADEDCDAQIAALTNAATTPRVSPATLRAAVEGLGAIAANGNHAATTALVGAAAHGDAVHDAAALALSGAAVRQPDAILAWLAMAPDDQRTTAVMLLKDGFEALEEDFGEEQFFAATRAAYWKSPEGSSGRALMASIIDNLEF